MCFRFYKKMQRELLSWDAIAYLEQSFKTHKECPVTKSRHACLMHEDQIHVTCNNRKLFDGVHRFGCVLSVWHALCQQQIDKELEVGLPTCWLTNQQHGWNSNLKFEHKQINVRWNKLKKYRLSCIFKKLF